MNTFSLLFISSVMHQDSQPYNSTDFMHVWKKFSFVSFLRIFDHQIILKRAKARRAFWMRALISNVVQPLTDIGELGYVLSRRIIYK
jgi:hypothetical protein